MKLITHEKIVELDNEEYNLVFYLDDLEENPRIYKVEVEHEDAIFVQIFAEEYAEKYEQDIIDEYFSSLKDYNDDMLYDIYIDRNYL